MNNIEISIIIPCYNSSETILRAIESVLSQSFKNIEIIVVDDCSDDETIKIIIDKYSKIIDKNILKLIQLNKNMGVATARNLGCDISVGKYLAFLDSDDTWYPNKLEIQYLYMESMPSVFLTGHLNNVLLKNEKKDTIISMKPNVKLLKSSDILFQNKFVTSSVMIRNKEFVRFENGQRYMEDHRLWLELSYKGHQIALIQECLCSHYKYAFGTSGLSKNLISMEINELQNYKYLYYKNYINLPLYLIVVTLSILKYIRRIILVKLR